MSEVGKAIPHEAAIGHVTGSALYVEDMPAVQGELWVDFAGAPVASGRLRGVNADEAKRIPGVVDIFIHDAISGKNAFGPIFHDEPFLVDDEISYLGQPVAIVAATSREVARHAKDAIQVEFEASQPILQIEDAIKANSFLGSLRRIESGDAQAAFATADKIIEGTFRNNGQEQFYLESQACQAIPGEQGQLSLLSSTQNPTETQAVVAEVLGLGMHQVVCRCQRMGGGFGGKETQSALAALMVSLVAQKTGKPARIVFSKHLDMLCTGKRHEYLSRYKVGFNNDGRIVAGQFEFFSNGGAFADLSTAVMERTMMHADNAYHLPNVSITGQVCKTNLPPNTAFRGFGGPQGVIVIENAIQEIAQTLGIDAIDVRKRNLYRDGDDDRNTTPYGQVVKNHVLPETLAALEQSSDYRERVKSVDEFNASSKTHLRGIAMSAIKFGISFTSKFLNQGNALVNVYTDGTVQVSTGGTEMGQGLNTKIQQLVADEFGVPAKDVQLMITSTEKNNNTSPTAASAGTDLNGTAAVIAAREIRSRLTQFVRKHFQTSNTDVSFASGTVRVGDHTIPFGELCDVARRNRVDLGQRSFYATPGVDFDRETGRGTPFFYFTTGAAVAEVTIDRFTGSATVDRVDLLMDLGRMINPGIDRGQVIGGFIQGMGWVTDEELVYNDAGLLLSTGPTTYKIPNITDLPATFNVDFIDNPTHEINVARSKAVGEPPLMLGIAPWLAVKHALSFVAPQRIADLHLPATSEETLMCLTRLQCLSDGDVCDCGGCDVTRDRPIVADV